MGGEAGQPGGAPVWRPAEKQEDETPGCGVRETCREEGSMVKLLSCTHGCPGQPRPARVTRSFRHQPSHAEVVVHGIPVNVCVACGQSFVEEETAEQLQVLLQSLPSPWKAKTHVEFGACSEDKPARL